MAQRKLRDFYFAVLQTRIGLLLSVLFRSWNLFKSESKTFFRKLRLIASSREFVNLTYMLSNESRDYLPYFLARLLDLSPHEVDRVLNEIEYDKEIADFYRTEIARSYRRLSSDPEIKPGRLLLHYAIVRLTKPRLVFEAGLDKGLGAIILNKALHRNRSEGYEARYVGVEYRKDRPAFLIENYPHRNGEVLYASWDDVFSKLEPQSVDFVFYDAAAFPDTLEKIVQYSDRLSPHAVLVYAWSFLELYDIATRIDRQVSVFHARAKAHWFDGAELCVMHPREISKLAFQSRPTTQ